ncbi:DNA polymerase III subunit epsilon [Pseudomonas rhizosphaerae]|uniref:DNA polymerase III subunit epsilon n=1 Tax=Pseudomonas rhizosphaerae TaxID=216142 RepID=A0A089YPZ1_9PSED|nr:3'-5' exonuclease [Pseudomonas rhizosphaerae]AIS18503.1 DNA polymerase III subunit epsilon [Pseudomonas rhizosphaerae]
MSLFDWLRAKPTCVLDATLQQRVAALPTAQPWQTCSLREQRWVVLDLETSGLNLNKDEVLSIGAVVIEDGAVDFSQQFERTLLREQPRLGASVLIHGLGPEAIAAGQAPAHALLDFMTFVGDSPLLAFHAPFDEHMLTRALKASLGYTLQHPFIDVAALAPMLCPDAALREAGLDDWTAHFGLQVGERHHASADALVTAELAMLLFSRARRQGLDSPCALVEKVSQWRRRQQTQAF